MRRNTGGGYKPPEMPRDSVEGAVAIRKAAMKIFARTDGEAANWPLVAESLFRLGFECLDKVKDDERRMSILRRLETGTYDRLVRNEPDPWQSQEPAGPAMLPIPEGYSPRIGIDTPGLALGPRRPTRGRH